MPTINLANSITLLRILLIPFFVYFLVYEQKLLALAIFCSSALTDGIDGFIARTRHQKTELGTFLDPLADKLLLTTSYVALAILHTVPPWLTIIVVSRDLIIVTGVLMVHILAGQLVISPTVWGKLTTFCQLVTISLALFFSVLDKSSSLVMDAAVVTAFFTILSCLHYVYRGMVSLNGNRGQ